MYECQQCGCNYITSRLDYICSTKCGPCFNASKDKNGFSRRHINYSSPIREISFASPFIPLDLNPVEVSYQAETVKTAEIEVPANFPALNVGNIISYKDITCTDEAIIRIQQAEPYTFSSDTTNINCTDEAAIGIQTEPYTTSTEITVITCTDDTTVGIQEVGPYTSSAETAEEDIICTHEEYIFQYEESHIPEAEAIVEDKKSATPQETIELQAAEPSTSSTGIAGEKSDIELRATGLPGLDGSVELYLDRSDSSSPERDSSSDSEYEATKFLEFYEGNNKGKYKYCDSYLKVVAFEEIGLTTRGKKPYKCKPCNHIFFSKTQRKNHSLIHTEKGDIHYSGVRLLK